MNVAIIITCWSLSFFLRQLTDHAPHSTGFQPAEKDVTRCLFIIMIPLIPLHAMLSVMKAFLNAKEQFAALNSRALSGT